MHLTVYVHRLRIDKEIDVDKNVIHSTSSRTAGWGSTSETHSSLPPNLLKSDKLKTLSWCSKCHCLTLKIPLPCRYSVIAKSLALLILHTNLFIQRQAYIYMNMHRESKSVCQKKKYYYLLTDIKQVIITSSFYRKLKI